MFAQHRRWPDRNQVHAELPPAAAASSTLLPKVERRFRELAAQAADNEEADQELADLRAELAQVQSQLNTVSGNMALAKTPEQFEAISTTFDQLKAQETSLQTEIAEAESKTEQMRDAEAEIAAAMEHGPPVDGTRVRLQWPGPSWGGVPAHQCPAVPAVSAGAGEEAAAQQGGRGCGGVRCRPGPDRDLPRPDRASGLELQRLAALAAAEPGKLGLPSPPENTIGSGLEGKSLRNVKSGRLDLNQRPHGPETPQGSKPNPPKTLEFQAF